MRETIKSELLTEIINPTITDDSKQREFCGINLLLAGNDQEILFDRDKLLIDGIQRAPKMKEYMNRNIKI